MSLPSGGQPTWIFDQGLRKWFWYNTQDDTYNYQDGQRVRRPANVPRSALRSNEDFQAYLRSLQFQQQQTSTYGSSPDEEPSYVYGRPPAPEGQAQPWPRTADRHPMEFPSTGMSSAARPRGSAAAPTRDSSVNDLTARMATTSVSQQPQRTVSGQQQEQQQQPSRQTTQGPAVPVRSGVIASQYGSASHAPTQNSRKLSSSSQQSSRTQPAAGYHQPVQPYLAQQLPGANAVPRAPPLQPNPTELTTQPQQQLLAARNAGVSQIDRTPGIRHPTETVPQQELVGPVEAVVSEHNGQRYVDVQHPDNGVRTFFQTAPPEAITDAALYEDGVRATRLLFGTEGETERLFESFRMRAQPRNFFTFGKVFLILWVEPAGETRTVVTRVQRGTTRGRYGEQVFSKVRRFVVVREGGKFCSALPIATYGKQGVGKLGEKKSDHGIIHTGKTPPQPLPAELPGRNETGMRPIAIRVDPDAPEDKLDPLSRIDYAKVHTIQHNVKVKAFGKVNAKSLAALQTQFKSVWDDDGRTRVPTESSIASSSRDIQITRALVASGQPSIDRSTGSGSHSSKVARSTGSKSSRSIRNTPAVGVIREQDSEDDNEEDGSGDEEEEEQDDEEEEEEEEEEENDTRSTLAQQYRARIADFMRRGYSQEEAIRILRDQIARQRRQQ